MGIETNTNIGELEAKLAEAETRIGVLTADIDEKTDKIAQLEKDMGLNVEAKITEERARVMELISMCDAHNVHDLQNDLISQGVSTNDASKKILEVLKTKTQAQAVINTQTSADGDGAPNPLLEACKQRAKEAQDSLTRSI